MNKVIERVEEVQEVEALVEVTPGAPATTEPFALPTKVKLSDAMREGGNMADGYSRTHYVYRRGQKIYACDIGRVYVGLLGKKAKIGGNSPSGFSHLKDVIEQKTGINICDPAKDYGLPGIAYNDQSIHDWVVGRNGRGCKPEETIRILEEHGL